MDSRAALAISGVHVGQSPGAPDSSIASRHGSDTAGIRLPRRRLVWSGANRSVAASGQ